MVADLHAGADIDAVELGVDVLPLEDAAFAPLPFRNVGTAVGHVDHHPTDHGGRLPDLKIGRERSPLDVVPDIFVKTARLKVELPEKAPGELVEVEIEAGHHFVSLFVVEVEIAEVEVSVRQTAGRLGRDPVEELLVGRGSGLAAEPEDEVEVVGRLIAEVEGEIDVVKMAGSVLAVEEVA